MSNEPGLNLTSLLVADRNAKAAIEISKKTREEIWELKRKVSLLESKMVQAEAFLKKVEEKSALSNSSTGPTER